MFSHARRPRLLHTLMRPDAEGQAFRLEGINGATGRHFLLPEPAAPVLNWLDGRHTLPDLALRFRTLTGRDVGVAPFEELIQELERLHLIVWEPASGAPAEAVRFPRHEACYLGYGPMLRDNLQQLLDQPTDDASLAPMDALLAPHIDLHRGHEAYARAYAPLGRQAPADLYVLLGTSHQPTRTTFVATRRTYRTPFGDLPVDLEALDALQARVGEGLVEQQSLHDMEHSLEFQALFIAFAHERRRLPMPTILPILVGPMTSAVMRRLRPSTLPAFRRFVDALGEVLAAVRGRVRLVAGVDLSHLGPRFGADRGLDPIDRHHLRQRDLATLRLACDVDPEGFWDDVVADHNARNICGLAPTYTLLHLLGARPSDGLHGRLWHYDQAVDEVGNVVSYGAVGYCGR